MYGSTKYQIFPRGAAWFICATAGQDQVFDRLHDAGVETMPVPAGQTILQTLRLEEPRSAAQLIYAGADDSGMQLIYGHRLWLPRKGACIIEFDCTVGASRAQKGREFYFQTRGELAAGFFFAGEVTYFPLCHGFLASPAAADINAASIAKKWQSVWGFLNGCLGACRFTRQTVLYWPLGDRLGLSAPGAGCAVDGGILLMPQGDEAAETWLMVHEAAHQWIGRAVRPEPGQERVYEDIPSELADQYVKNLGL